MCNKEENDRNCLGDYNEALMDPLEHYARFALQILIVAGSILDIACLKWRHIANWLLYHECLLRCVALLIRNRFAQENSIIDITMLFVWIGVC